ncbi:hypothetical protein LEP1GSC191_1055 [Leptospira borgpetersenii serovar Mini str. 201000851]|uniref:Uncharacterized protein n=2 Tax=Leptospira borgpetersenii TaxID=174 RepID=A0ABP2S1H7_LEPBO|nr:hypothetical protein LEP1GSC128_0262 [Leptospira borgpetersenii str. 200801926]EKQ90955.1 hypothetical protein LEP1GSC101_1190 [Leptospira borgpetersenii str. UI 09149]EMK09591.1 hypothetical protein LEP1GSC066_2464 [Leptospira sp. serovar Kenya str. Sh9]EMN14511.1 hypothetical protein LEP1GSC055_1815 [Leptospira borgpetersenii str. Brem 307]EMN18796.1 hypothetical protein LEP1GSC056_1210 [Leptospira borgpetersenii str. Brem 328]EMN56696.1 hypothetical protein LEP1GSC090_0258 [Leptospira bo
MFRHLYKIKKQQNVLKNSYAKPLFYEVLFNRVVEKFHSSV